MRTTTRKTIPVLDLEGEIERGHLAQIQSLLEGWMQESRVDVVIDFSHVTHLDFIILGILAENQQRLRNLHGGLRLAGLNPYLCDLIRLMGVDALFESYESVESALAGIRRKMPMRH